MKATGTIRGDNVDLASEDRGDGPPIVLLHGLTATRNHVVMGSGILAASGMREIAYDARGHGQSSSSAADGYGYEKLTADLSAVLDQLGLERPVLAGASMGAHTAAALALRHPERVAAIALITPAYDPEDSVMAGQRVAFSRLADALRQTGIDGFLEAYGGLFVTDAWREPVLAELGERMRRHDSLGAVADALDHVPASRPFGSLDDLARIHLPVLVVGSRDESDPMHPLELARRYAQALPRADLVVEEPHQVPLAWQGGRLSRILAQFAANATVSRA